MKKDGFRTNSIKIKKFLLYLLSLRFVYLQAVEIKGDIRIVIQGR